jgi:hypothetical protein
VFIFLPGETVKKIFLLFVLLTGLSYAQRDTVIVRPKPIDDVLQNPNMGITTFNRFNGQATNPLLKWSEIGPVEKVQQAASKPDFPDTTIAYLRWYWNALEPERGKYRWDIIDLAIAEARAHGQTLAIRLMPYSNQDPLPSWYESTGARRGNKPTDKDGAIWQPDFSDPIYLKLWSQLVAEAGRRYDGNPYLDSVDISSVGYWGEGWSPYMPAFQYQKALIDIWFDAFPRTTLLMNFDEPTALTYGTSRGAGWRLDCLGDLRVKSDNPYFEPEMLDVYPQQVVRSGVQDVWEKRPVSLEVCGTVSEWKRDHFDLDYILEQALRWHVTSVNLKSSPIPDDWKPRFDAFQKKLGYRLSLRRLEYPKSVAPGTMMPIHMWWLNAGVAPPYTNYSLVVQLRADKSSAVMNVPVDVRKWLPGDAVYDGSLYVPENLADGVYDFRVAMLDPRTGSPVVRFAIAGRDEDGWYSEGQIKVEKK